MRLIDVDKLIEKLRDFKEWENDDGRPIHTMSETQRIDRCVRQRHIISFRNMRT